MKEHEKTQEEVGILLALAYPDRIAQQQPGDERRYLSANGKGAAFSQPECLRQSRIWSLQISTMAESGPAFSWPRRSMRPRSSLRLEYSAAR